MENHSCYEGPFKYKAGDFVIDVEAEELIIGEIVERLDTLPGPAYKVDFPACAWLKRKLESQLRLERDSDSIWEELNTLCDLATLSEFQGIRSGAFCEAILKAGDSFANAKELLYRVAEKHFGVKEDICKTAIELYCCEDDNSRVLAHYRHPHSDPEKIFQFGAFLKLSRSDDGQKILLLDYESKDRVIYGNRPQTRKFLSLKDALNEIEFLGKNFWYANFVHPDAHEKLPRYRYVGPEGDFVSWKEIAGYQP